MQVSNLKKLEVRSRKSEVGSQKSEVRSRKSEVGSQKSKVRSRKSEVGTQKWSSSAIVVYTLCFRWWILLNVAYSAHKSVSSVICNAAKQKKTGKNK